MNLSESRRAAVGAATEAGEAAGFRAARPVVLQDSNNVVVWLAPHEVVAKVGVWPHSAEVLGREVDACAHLAAVGAPVAVPIGALRHTTAMNWPVSLWERLQPASTDSASDRTLAKMLQQVHAGLASCAVELPSYRVALDHARETLFDDLRMSALPRRDLHLLRGAFDEWRTRTRDWSAQTQPLHGDLHLGNVIIAAGGPVLIDFEAVCNGPLEWDLASMPAGVVEAAGPVDNELLVLLRLLNSARVATWCWSLADHETMRALGEHHLAVVRAAAE